MVLCLSEKFDRGSLKPLITALGLRTRFPKEFDAWESGKNEIERRFQKIFSQRKAEIHEKIEQDFEGVRIKVRRAVVNELLKTLPWALITPWSAIP